MLFDDDDARRAVEAAVEAVDGASVSFAADAPSDELMDALLPTRPPRSSTVLQLHRNIEERLELIEELGVLTADELAELAGSKAQNPRATASRWRAQGRIFGVRYRNRTVFPAFQFDEDTHTPRHAIGQVLSALPLPLRAGGWDLAFWWTTPNDALDWDRPVDHLDEPSLLRQAAEAEAHLWADANPVTRDET